MRGNRWRAYSLVLLLLSACSFVKLDRELAAITTYGALSGTVVHEGRNDAAIVVVAYRREGSETVIADYQVLSRPGPFVFVLPHATYFIAAFEDLNADLVYDPAEPAGLHGAPDPINVSAAIVEAVYIEVSADGRMPRMLPPDMNESDVAKRRYDPGLGAIADLDDPIYAADIGRKGLWEPLTFIKAARGGVFFVENFSPHKIPVLFIHGAGGSPQDWRFFIDNFDRDRYQPWVFYYASGLPLEEIAFWLNRTVEALHARYGFNRLAVVAHSMGGLVAMRFLQLNAEASNGYARSFVSLATPWGGVSSARLGVDYAPAVIPSWEDLVPESPFLRSLYAAAVPAGIRWDLLCAEAHGALVRGAGDGVITVATQLEERLISKATSVHCIVEDHMGILSSPEVLTRVEAVLRMVK